MNEITYQIRIDRRDSDIVWIDRFVASACMRTHGPYWSKWEAQRQISKWEAEAAR